jgi:hypothetical protein
MQLIAKACKYSPILLLTHKATRGAVTQSISKAAAETTSGDIFLLSYSGHGGQLPDLNGDEDDGQDETWCLFDGELVDDELYSLFSKFAAGVRVLVFSDSCHSGTVVKELLLEADHHLLAANLMYAHAPKPVYRAMPADVAHSVYLRNKSFYDKILLDKDIAESKEKVKASVLLVSGCQDNQLSADGTFNGRFTGALKRAWNGGKFSGNYAAFRTAINQKMKAPDQTSWLFTVGSANPSFLKQKPFTI